METFLQDLRFAVRNLLRTPALPLAAIGTLALGIGSTTAIFGTVNAALLRPLPYRQSENLYSLHTALTDGRPTSGLLSPAELLRLNSGTGSIERAAAILPQAATLLRDDGTPIHKPVYGVTEGFFELFGLPMTLGGFTAGDYHSNGPPLVVVSYRIWKDFYGGDRAIVGKPIHFAELSATVAGVAPRDFDTPHDADFWFNVRLNPEGVDHNYESFMRLRPGANLDRARSELASVMAGLARDFPASDIGRVYVVRPLVESIVGDLGPILLVVLSATGLLLILACVNVTNLLLARGAARAREMAVRVALGASRGRIVRQLLTESILLSAAGAAAGLGVAFAGLRALLRLGAAQLPRLDSVPFDGNVTLFALGLLLVSGVLVGFAPALRLARTDVKTLMNDSGRSASVGPGTARWLAAMTVAEIALAVTLVAGAGWLIRNFANLSAIDPGFVSDRRLTFDVSFQGAKYPDPPAIVAAWTDLLDRVRGLAGVVAAGTTTDLPLRGSQENSIYIQLHGEPFDPGHPRGTRARIVSPGFFEAAGIRLLSGRDFNWADRRDTAQVVIVNRTFVRRHLAGQDPLTVRFASGYPSIDPRSEAAIIGVVDDVRQRSLADPPEPSFYTPTAQTPVRRQTVVVHTTAADTGLLQTAIRDEVRRIDPTIALEFQSFSDVVGSTLARQRLGMTLMLLFGVSAVALAAIGIYGVIAYAASQRHGEVATRLALGATSSNVFWLMMREGRLLAALGGGIGLALAYSSGRLVSSRLFDVRASDPAILGAALLLVLIITLVATMIPAYRAATLNPARVLRPDAT